VESALRELEACAIVRRVAAGSYEFEPELDARSAVDELIELYVNDPADVLRELSSRSVERIRDSASQLLADPLRRKREPR
jgi:hypothetical protein